MSQALVSLGASTAELKPVPNGLAGYEMLVRNAYFPMNLSMLDRREGFRSEAASQKLGSIVMTRFRAAGDYEGYLDHTRIRSSPDAGIVLNLSEVGGVHYGGRLNISTQPRHLTVLDPHHPIEVEHIGETQALAIHLPKKPMISRYGCIDDFFFNPVDASSGIAAILWETVTCYWNQASYIDRAPSAELLNVVLDLIGAVFCRSDHGPGFGSLPGRVHFLRIRDLIREELENEDLSAEYISDALGISKSHIYSVMSLADTTPGKFIMEQRLERARQLLELSSARKRSISEIAYSVGFQDSAHFSRRFSAAFGMSPRLYRNRFGQQGSE